MSKIVVVGESIVGNKLKELLGQGDHEMVALADQKIVRANVRKKQLTLEDKNKIDYDVLVITDMLETKYPDIRGTNKQGVYWLRKPSHMKDVNGQLPILDTIVIEGNSVAAVELAYALSQKEKEVILTTPEILLSNVLNETRRQELKTVLEENKIRVFEEDGIDEVLGDQDVKAVRLKHGKVIATQVVVFDEAVPNLKVFKDSGLNINQKICVNEQFKASEEGVFAADLACETPWVKDPAKPLDSLKLLEQQTDVIVAVIRGTGTSFIPIEPVSMITLGDCSITIEQSPQKPSEITPQLSS